MTQKDKEPLLKDLCARLPYGVKIDIRFSDEHGSSFRSRVCNKGLSTLNVNKLSLFQQHEIEIKPYLFPMSSMTDEQWKELTDLQIQCGLQSLGSEPTISPISISDVYTIDWLNKKHFDYRGLIEKGLAIDATRLNIY